MKQNVMLSTSAAKHCLQCGNKIAGRTDKKFCNDYCRNAYNNQLKTVNNATVRNINNALIKNRRILETLIGPDKTVKLPKDKLLQQGFNFKYFTHHYINQKGNVYVFCYEYGYLTLEHAQLLLVKRKEEPNGM